MSGVTANTRDAEERNGVSFESWSLVGFGEQLARLAFDLEPGVLIGLRAGMRGDTLHEVEQARGRMPFLGDHRLDDLGSVGLGEAILAQEGLAIFIGTRDDATACCLNAFDEAQGRAVVTPKQLQCDVARGFLYWCDREGMGVLRSRTDGSGLTQLLRTGDFPDQSEDVLRHCVGIAIDSVNRHIYWTQKGPPDAGLGRIYRMGLDLPDGENPKTRSDVELLLDHLPEPIDLEIDHERGELYWTDRGNLSEGNSVNCAEITPAGLLNHRVLATGLKEGIGLALDLSKRRAFIGDLSGAIRILPLDGGSMATIHEVGLPVTGLAFAEAHV